MSLHMNNENAPPVLRTPHRSRARDLVSPDVSRIPRLNTQETPRTKAPVPARLTTPLSARTRPLLTPRQSTTRPLDESLKENVIQRQKTTELRLEDIQREKYAVQNERDGLRTELHLARQRELRLKATIEKHEHTIARYRARAQVPAPQPDARPERSDAHAARIAELERENADLRDELEHAAASEARNCRALTACAHRMLREAAARHRSETARLRKCLADTRGAHEKSESYCGELQTDNARLAGMLSEAVERGDALHKMVTDMDADATQLSRNAVAAEDTWERELASKHDTLTGLLDDVRAHDLEQEHDMHQLVEELDRVSWYQEAYEERCEQVRLLAQVAQLAEYRWNELAHVNAELLAQAPSPHCKSRVSELSGSMDQLVTLRVERAELTHRIARLEQELATYRTVASNGTRSRESTPC